MSTKKKPIVYDNIPTLEEILKDTNDVSHYPFTAYKFHEFLISIYAQESLNFYIDAKHFKNKFFNPNYKSNIKNKVTINITTDDPIVTNVDVDNDEPNNAAITPFTSMPSSKKAQFSTASSINSKKSSFLLPRRSSFLGTKKIAIQGETKNNGYNASSKLLYSTFIVNEYVLDNAPEQVNIKHDIKQAIETKIKGFSTDEKVEESVFDDAQEELLHLMSTDGKLSL